MRYIITPHTYIAAPILKITALVIFPKLARLTLPQKCLRKQVDTMVTDVLALSITNVHLLAVNITITFSLFTAECPLEKIIVFQTTQNGQPIVRYHAYFSFRVPRFMTYNVVIDLCYNETALNYIGNMRYGVLSKITQFLQGFVRAKCNMTTYVKLFNTTLHKQISTG